MHRAVVLLIIAVVGSGCARILREQKLHRELQATGEWGGCVEVCRLEIKCTDVGRLWLASGAAGQVCSDACTDMFLSGQLPRGATWKLGQGDADRELALHADCGIDRLSRVERFVSVSAVRPLRCAATCLNRLNLDASSWPRTPDPACVTECLSAMSLPAASELRIAWSAADACRGVPRGSERDACLVRRAAEFRALDVASRAPPGSFEALVTSADAALGQAGSILRNYFVACDRGTEFDRKRCVNARGRFRERAAARAQVFWSIESFSLGVYTFSTHSFIATVAPDVGDATYGELKAGNEPMEARAVVNRLKARRGLFIVVPNETRAERIANIKRFAVQSVARVREAWGTSCTLTQESPYQKTFYERCDSADRGLVVDLLGERVVDAETGEVIWSQPPSACDYIRLPELAEGRSYGYHGLGATGESKPQPDIRIQGEHGGWSRAPTSQELDLMNISGAPEPPSECVLGP